ncbi:MAG: peptidoglycan/LPS O-acetylase OafA/YrhL [Paraglaciecola sp.]
MFFVTQIWFLSAIPFSNGPFWSLGYEFWYYVIFAIVFYIKTPIKYLLLLVICLFVGPKILLLLPIWLMGVMVYKITISGKISEPSGWGIFIFSI